MSSDSLFEQDNVLTVAEFYEAVKQQVKKGFPYPIWLVGEIRTLTVHHRSGHVYIDLCDDIETASNQTPTLSVAIWKSTWAVISKKLNEFSIDLKEGQVIKVLGSPDIYPPASRISFIVKDLDIDALVGSLKRKRDLLIKKLIEQGIDKINKKKAFPVVPLKIYLIGSPQTEGISDFIKQLKDSGFGFKVSVYPVTVQGDQAAKEIIRALKFADYKNYDVAVIVRGGGSRTDLSVFDDEQLAYSIANCKIPVLTGIGHSGDLSIADIVAYEHFETPTACGKALVEAVTQRFSELRNLLTDLVKVSKSTIDSAQHELRLKKEVLTRSTASLIQTSEYELNHKIQHIRSQMNYEVRSYEGQVKTISELCLKAVKNAEHVLQESFSSSIVKLLQLAPLSCAYAEKDLKMVADSLIKTNSQFVREKENETRNLSRLLEAYDPDKQLARGWSITLDTNGQIVNSIKNISVSDVILTKIKDGVITSEISQVSEKIKED